MKRFMLTFLTVAMFVMVDIADAQTVIVAKDKNEKGDMVEFVRFTTKNLNVYLVSPKDGVLNTDVQIGIPVPFFKSLSVGVGGAGTNSFTDRFSFGVWGGDTLATTKSFVAKWAIGRMTVNEKGLTTRWFFPVSHRKLSELSLSPQIFYNTVPHKNIFDYGIGVGVEKRGLQVLVTFWKKQGTWFLMKKTFGG